MISLQDLLELTIFSGSWKANGWISPMSVFWQMSRDMLTLRISLSCSSVKELVTAGRLGDRSQKKRSPFLRRANWSPMIHLKTGPIMESRWTASIKPPTNRSISSTSCKKIKKKYLNVINFKFFLIFLCRNLKLSKKKEKNSVSVK